MILTGSIVLIDRFIMIRSLGSVFDGHGWYSQMCQVMKEDDYLHPLGRDPAREQDSPKPLDPSFTKLNPLRGSDAMLRIDVDYDLFDHSWCAFQTPEGSVNCAPTLCIHACQKVCMVLGLHVDIGWLGNGMAMCVCVDPACHFAPPDFQECVFV